MSGYDYARLGRVGIGTPQANPTVEDEMAILLPPGTGMAVTRLTSGAAAPVDRLREYLLRLDRHLDTFDTLKPDVFGFACTASSYLVDPAVAAVTIELCRKRHGYPIITAADAIASALDRIGARRIALVSPYPHDLALAAKAGWQRRGYQVTAVAAAGDLAPGGDTRAIYALGSADAARALSRLDLRGVDAVLLSGTGMPSLPLIASSRDGPPILSSNLCLASALCEHLGAGDLLTDTAWHARCRAAIAPSPKG